MLHRQHLTIWYERIKFWIACFILSDVEPISIHCNNIITMKYFYPNKSGKDMWNPDHYESILGLIFQYILPYSWMSFFS